MIKMDDAVNLLVGNPVTDSEHLELILLVNLVYNYSNNTKYKTAIPSLVVLLTTKLLAHCKSEEEVMAKLRCSNLEAHKLEHKIIVDNTISMLENITLDTVKDFEQMLSSHILMYDIPSFHHEL